MSNFKDTIYSILNEAPEDRDARIAREEAAAEVRRKASFERAQAKRKAEIDNPQTSKGTGVGTPDYDAKRTQDLKRRQAEAEAEEKFRRTLRGEGSEKQPESSSKPTPSATPPSTPPTTPPAIPSTPSATPPTTPSATPSTPTPMPTSASTEQPTPSTPSRPLSGRRLVWNNSFDSDDERHRREVDAAFDDQSTTSSLTTRLNNITDARRGSTATAIVDYIRSQTNKRNASRTMREDTGYSHNKALTFFAEQLKRKYIEEEVVNPDHQPMSKSEISHRNKIRGKSPAKDARVVKGPRGRLDTSEEAKYRLATYITMRGRKAKKKENK
jgi:hypothetical protein